MGGSHPGSERAQGVFDRAASGAHHVWITLHPRDCLVNEMFALPASDPTFLASCSVEFQAGSAGIGASWLRSLPTVVTSCATINSVWVSTAV